MPVTRTLYQSLCRIGDAAVVPFLPERLRPVWHHPAGPKTVFFWAPTIKWALVAAGVADLARPVERLSVSQSSALTATGTIWARYCLVIVPKNYYLCSVNCFVALTGIIQLSRIIAFVHIAFFVCVWFRISIGYCIADIEWVRRPMIINTPSRET